MVIYIIDDNPEIAEEIFSRSLSVLTKEGELLPFYSNAPKITFETFGDEKEVINFENNLLNRPVEPIIFFIDLNLKTGFQEFGESGIGVIKFLKKSLKLNQSDLRIYLHTSYSPEKKAIEQASSAGANGYLSLDRARFDLSLFLFPENSDFIVSNDIPKNWLANNQVQKKSFSKSEPHLNDDRFISNNSKLNKNYPKKLGRVLLPLLLLVIATPIFFLVNTKEQFPSKYRPIYQAYKKGLFDYQHSYFLTSNEVEINKLEACIYKENYAEKIYNLLDKFHVDYTCPNDSCFSRLPIKSKDSFTQVDSSIISLAEDVSQSPDPILVGIETGWTGQKYYFLTLKGKKRKLQKDYVKYRNLFLGRNNSIINLKESNSLIKSVLRDIEDFDGISHVISKSIIQHFSNKRIDTIYSFPPDIISEKEELLFSFLGTVPRTDSNTLFIEIGATNTDIIRIKEKLHKCRAIRLGKGSISYTDEESFSELQKALKKIVPKENEKQVQPLDSIIYLAGGMAYIVSGLRFPILHQLRTDNSIISMHLSIPLIWRDITYVDSLIENDWGRVIRTSDFDPFIRIYDKQQILGGIEALKIILNHVGKDKILMFKNDANWVIPKVVYDYYKKEK